MKRAAFALALLMLATSARSDGLGNLTGRIGQGDFGGIGGGFAKAAPQPTGDILLADGVSFILQTDGTSLICRAGGC
jgi:hypothetical protein